MSQRDGITQTFYELMGRLKSIEKFLLTLYRLEIINEKELRVIYHSSHSRCIEEMKKT